MSAKSLEEQLKAHLGTARNESAIVSFFNALTESERRELAPATLAWYRAAIADWMGRKLRSGIELPCPAGFLIEGIAFAVLASATWSEIRKLPDWDSDKLRELEPDLIFSVLATRQPDWIAEWAEDYAQKIPRHWKVIRRLVRQGILPASLSDAMTSGLLATLDSQSRYGGPSLRDQLLADPALLEEAIWRLFEVQRPDSLSFAFLDEWRNSGRANSDTVRQAGWLETFVEFAAEGRLSRQRLLEASLSAIEREFPEAISRWFPRLHVALAPTQEEQIAFRSRYLALLRSTNGSTVMFALERLQSLEALGALPWDDAIASLGNTLTDRTKSRAKLALKLIERLARRHPVEADAMARAAVAGLWHAATDVQHAVWKFISKTGRPDQEPLKSALLENLDRVAPSVRETILGCLGIPQRPASNEQAASSSHLDFLFQSAARLPLHLAAAAGIPALIAAVRAGQIDRPAVELQQGRFPRLRRRLPVLKSVDELIDAAAAAIEGVRAPEQIETLFEGLSRLCDQRPPDFERHTAPLKKRTLAKLQANATGGGAVFLGSDLQTDLNAVVWAWLTGEVCEPTILREINDHQQNLWGAAAGGESWIGFPPDEPSSLMNAFSHRARALAERVARLQALPLLSAATHEGGWIDPLVLVERVQNLDAHLREVPLFDQALALLRLAPDGRAEALTRLARDVSEFHSALRYALGSGEESPDATAALWCAAARARSPWGDDLPIERRHPDLGPDMGLACQTTLEFHPGHTHPGKIVLKTRPQRLATRPQPMPEFHMGRLREDFVPPPLPPVEPHPIQWLHEGLPRLWMQPGADLAVRWSFTVWPASGQPLLGRGLFHLLKNVDFAETLWGNRMYLERLLDRDEPMTSLGLLVLCLGLAAKEPMEKSVATDASIAAITDGRLTAAPWGAILCDALRTGLLKVSRWVTTLATVHQPSLLHADVVRGALAMVFRGETRYDIRDLNRLLELFLELTVATGQAVPEEIRGWLEGAPLKGSVAKTARKLLALPAEPNREKLAEIHGLALSGRIERVRSWRSVTEI